MIPIAYIYKISVGGVGALGASPTAPDIGKNLHNFDIPVCREVAHVLVRKVCTNPSFRA